MSNNINKVAVIGTGVIGAGWIIRCLAHNKKVVAFDKDLKLKNLGWEPSYGFDEAVKIALQRM